MRTMRRVLVLVLVVAVAGAAALVGTARPALEDAYDDASARWDTVARALDPRYDALGDTAATVREAGGNGAAVAADVDDGVRRWRAARRSGDTSAQVTAANDLEGLARRLDATIAASERLSADPAVGDAQAVFTSQPVPESARAYNAAVDDYEEERSGVLRSLAAGVLGYDALAHLDTGGPPAG